VIPPVTFNQSGRGYWLLKKSQAIKRIVCRAMNRVALLFIGSKLVDFFL